MKPTDLQLKTALLEMLPDYVEGAIVLPTELLHLCWLAEEGLSHLEREDYVLNLHNRSRWNMLHASWQERVIALAKAKGIEIE